jgi:hypothetical protein
MCHVNEVFKRCAGLTVSQVAANDVATVGKTRLSKNTVSSRFAAGLLELLSKQMGNLGKGGRNAVVYISWDNHGITAKNKA